MSADNLGTECPRCGHKWDEPDWRCPECYYEFGTQIKTADTKGKHQDSIPGVATGEKQDEPGSKQSPLSKAGHIAQSSDSSTGSPREESLGECLKFFGFTLIILPVSLGIAFLMYNMARYNYARLPNPIAFVMMVVTGGFGLLVGIAGPGAFCNAIYQVARAVISKSQGSHK